MIPTYGIAIGWMVAFLVTGVRLNRWRCPRCGKLFCATKWYNKSFFARKCAHCGLPKFAIDDGPPEADSPFA